LLLAGCGEGAPEQPAQAQQRVLLPAGTRLPNGARLEPSGYPTILYAEPARLPVPLPRRAPIDGGIGETWAAAIRKAPTARPFLRVISVTDREAGLVPAIALYGTLQLRDGCLRLTPGPGVSSEAHAVFSPGTRSFIDPEGYLAIGVADPNARFPVRVGEGLVFGAAPAITNQKIVAAVRRACGPGPLLWVNGPSSSFGYQWAEAARNAARAAEIHGVSIEVARAKMQEELRANEAKRRRCTLAPDPSCTPRAPVAGEPIDSWLLTWPPPPPVRNRSDARQGS
jgi:hypothetical protein